MGTKLLIKDNVLHCGNGWTISISHDNSPGA